MATNQKKTVNTKTKNNTKGKSTNKKINTKTSNTKSQKITNQKKNNNIGVTKQKKNTNKKVSNTVNNKKNNSINKNKVNKNINTKDKVKNTNKKSVKKENKFKSNLVKFFSKINIKKGIKKSKKFDYKKCLIAVSIICGIILLCEIGYVAYRNLYVEKNSTYYDSINSLTVDGDNTVAVGSSNFKYSKYNDYTNGLEKAKIVKYDKNGNILFEKMYDNGINSTFNSIISVDDGYIVVGSGEFSKEEQESEGREAIIVKYNKDGEKVWEKFYQVITYSRFNKVIEVDDGYIVVGQSIYANLEFGNQTDGGGIIVKYDKDGNEVWHNNHGGMKSGNFNDVVEVNKDLYVVGKDATDSGNLVKYNKDGEYQWHKNYSYTDSIGFTGITYMDNSLYVVGSKKVLADDITEDDDRTTTNTDGLLVKYSLDGTKVFEKTFGGSNYERYNSITSYASKIYVVGHTTSSDIGLKVTTDGSLMTGLIIRFDKDGNITKKDVLGGSNDDSLTDIVTDGVSLYISGYSNSLDGNITTAKNNGKDYFGKVIKLDFKFRTLMVK